MEVDDLRDEVRGQSTPPFPPANLLSRIGPTPDPETEAGREFFDSTGRDRKRAILDILPDGYSLEGRRVLDFGCGAGRVLRHFTPEASATEFWGCDLHPPTIEWLAQNLSPAMRFFVNDERPLPNPEGYFDLVYALSVFTHITYEWSDWLLEVHRVLKPDGLFLATFMGPPTWKRAAQQDVDEDELGMAVLGLQRELGGTSGPIVIHSPWWIRAHWGRAFEVLELRPAGFVDSGTGHGFLLGRKRQVALTTGDLERPDPDDPRELAAQRLQIALLERNAARLRDQVQRHRDRNASLAERLERLRRVKR